MNFIKLLFLTILIQSSTLVFSQNSYTISGKVLSEDNQPISMVAMYFHEIQKVIFTNDSGHFDLSDIQQGSYHIHFTILGFETKTEYIFVNKDQRVFNFTLNSTSIELSEVRIESSITKKGVTKQSQSITSIGKDFLDKNLGNDLMSTLQVIPGVNSINTGVGISKPIIRGMSFNRVLVNDRGIKQEGQQWGAEHGLEIDQFDVEHIELVKGASSLMYGSDAMGGVINIHPSTPPQLNTLNGEVLGLFKTNNDLYGTSVKLEGNKKGVYFKGRFSYQDYGNYRIPAESFTYGGYVLPVYENRLKNTAGKEINYSGTVGTTKKWGFSNLSVSNYNLTAGLFPGAVGFPRAFMLVHENGHRNIAIPRQEVNHFKVISNSNIKIKNNWLEVDLAFQHNDRKELVTPEAFNITEENFVDFGNLSLGLNLYTYTANARFHHQWNKKLHNVYGFQNQLSINEQRGFEFLLPNYTSFQSGLFSYFQYDYSKKTTYNLGVRFDYSTHDISKHEQAIYNNDGNFTGDYQLRNPDIQKQFTNYSAATGLSYLLNKDWSYKLNLGSSFRFPTPMELSSNGIHHGMFRHEIGDANLTQERGYQMDMELGFKKKNFTFMVTPFLSKFNDFIYLAPTGNFSTLGSGGTIWRYTQTDVVFMGSESNIEYHPIKNLHLNISGEYVYNQSLNTGLGLPMTPPLKISTDVEYEKEFKKKWINDASFGANYSYYFAQNNVDRNELTTPAFDLFKVSLGAEFMIKKQPINFQITIQNALNSNYLNHTSRYRLLNLPEQGRNFIFSLRVPFSSKI